MGAIDTYPPQNVSAQTPVLAFASSTSNLVGVGSETDVTGCTVTVTVPGGRRIKVVGRIEVGSPSTNLNAFLLIRETTAGNAEVGRASAVVNTSTESTLTAETIITPSAGVHTYKLTLQTNTGTINTSNISSSPNFISVEDITGSQLPVLPQSVPVGVLAYAQITTAQTGISTETALTGLSINISIPSGRTVRLTARVGAQRTVADGLNRLRIKEGGTTVILSDMFVRGALEGSVEQNQSVVISPSSGAHTYNVTYERVTGSGTINADANTAYPAYLMAEDITPTPAPGQGAPGSTLGYAEVTANQGSITSEVDLTGLAVNVTVPAGRRIRITGYIPSFASTAADNAIILRIREGVTQVSSADVTVSAASVGDFISAIAVITPTAGSHTYKLTMERVIGAGTVTMGASSIRPAFILVEDITGAVWPVGSTVTAGMVASEPWISYVPTLTASTTNPTLGTGAIAQGKYIKIGRQVTGWLEIVFGTGMTAGNGYYRFGLPVAAAPPSTGMSIIADGFFVDAGVNNFLGTGAVLTGEAGTYFRIIPNAQPDFITHNSPVVWATNDSFRFKFQYEAVS